MTDDRRSLARVPWHTVSSRPIYANPWIRVREDVAAMPDGRRTLYGVIEWRPGTVMVTGAIIGGYTGASMARRLDQVRVRRFVIAIGWLMTAYFFIR